MSQTGPAMLASWSERNGEDWSDILHPLSAHKTMLTYSLKYWSIYTLDIYSSIVWGGIIRCRERQSNVAYPIEVDDELIDDHGIVGHDPAASEESPSLSNYGSSIQANSWLSGWNFVTDLYRVLEHALSRFRGHRYRAPRSTFLHDIFEDYPTVTEASVQDRVLRMYLNLPSCFKETPEMTYNAKRDRFGFQAANITATFQLLRIILFAAGGASIEQRCQVASEVVEAFLSIPISYLLSISTPLLHHLGGIGTILGSVLEEPLSETDYNRVRGVMLALAQLLESLEVIHRNAIASEKLRSQVLQIDEYMARQRQVSTSEVDPTVPEGVLQRSALQDMESGNYEQPIPEISDNWMLQVPVDLLGDLTWNFDLG
jgi:hypothetical protein